MYICATEAAKLLGISPRRMRSLLQQGRVEDAFKVGKSWVIPLLDGRPVVKLATRGVKPTWSQKVRQRRQEDLKVVKVLQKEIKRNQKKGTTDPVISVTNRDDPAYHVHEIYIHGPARLCYSLKPRKDKGGASLWLETIFPIEMFKIDFEQNTRVYRHFV